VIEAEFPDHVSDWFWEVVEDAHQDVDRMRAKLDEMDVADLLRFHYDLEDATVELTDEPYASYITRESEDGAEDLTYWVVSRGRAYCRELRDKPWTIPHCIECAQKIDRRSSVHVGLALAIYHDRTGQFPPEREDDDDDEC
jgi:hypothetical protein